MTLRLLNIIFYVLLINSKLSNSDTFSSLLLITDKYRKSTAQTGISISNKHIHWIKSINNYTFFLVIDFFYKKHLIFSKVNPSGKELKSKLFYNLFDTYGLKDIEPSESDLLAFEYQKDT